MSLRQLPRLIRTARHLRPSQIYWRGRYTAWRRISHLFGDRGRPTVSANGSLPQFPTDLSGSLAIDETPPDAGLLAQLSCGTFQHLNVARELGRPPDWRLQQSDRDRLWTVTLHYHRWAYDLAQLAARDDPQRREAGPLFVEYLSDWINHCDPRASGATNLAWNAYATATRIGWWIRAALLLGPAWWAEQAEFRGRFIASLRKQAAYLDHNIEWDLRANHLLRDAVGLAWAGRFLGGPQAAHWLAAATALAGDQVREQILSDGGHFERSPWYHLRVMNDLFVLSQLIENSAVRHEIETALDRMADFARWTRHPDGAIPLLNDAALESESPPDGIFHRLRQIGLDVDAALPGGGRHFADTGLAVWHGTPWTVFFDVGPIGPDYQPGHGHADNLTLECSYEGVRLFVDPGTHSYDRDERRVYDRSTAAHNTVCVDRADSSEVWHIFRVGRRARPLDVDVRISAGVFDASAAHDGYSHPFGVIHRRRVQVGEGNSLIVTDRIEGEGRHRVEAGWLLEPGWTVTPSVRGWQLRQGARVLRVAVESAAVLLRTVESRPWHPRFGVEWVTNRLTWAWDGALPFEVTTVVEPGGR